MISSRSNPLVKSFRQLHTSKGRREAGLFLLEGTHLLMEAVGTNYPLETLCATPQWWERHGELGEQASNLATRVEMVTIEVLQAMATTVQPDGVVAIAPSREEVNQQNLRQQLNVEFLELQESQGAAWRSPPSPEVSTANFLGIAGETLQDPGNVGTMIRTAVATGVQGLWLSRDSVDGENPKVLRASAGQWFRLAIDSVPDLTTVVRSLQTLGIQVVATNPRAELTYWQVDFTAPTLILLGNEGAGLSADLLALADRQVQIPLLGGVESLNVAISSAVMLYEAQRQRQQFSS
ncbi:MAG: RNA methyltransferase [Coleofasciculaceae cyanobacterium SM2_1_6]|nr:RNA methyltransferase [Coleofasciculaceae cyanobacterium SM2_1_6]